MLKTYSANNPKIRFQKLDCAGKTGNQNDASIFLLWCVCILIKTKNLDAANQMTAIHLSAESDQFFEALKLCPDFIKRHILVGSMDRKGRSFSLPGHTRSPSECWNDLESQPDVLCTTTSTANQTPLEHNQLEVVYVKHLDDIKDEQAAFVFDLAGYWYLDKGSSEWLASSIRGLVTPDAVLIAGMIQFVNNWAAIVRRDGVESEENDRRIRIYTVPLENLET